MAAIKFVQIINTLNRAFRYFSQKAERLTLFFKLKPPDFFSVM